MTEQSPTFNTICASASEAFLQTVVVIDNQPSVGETSVEPKRAVRKRSSAPGTGPADEADQKSAVAAEREPSAGPSERDSHVLELNVVANAFAKRKLTCGVYLPTKIDPKDDDDLIETACSAILPTDACVLDWQLRDNDASQATEVVKRVLTKDREAGGKLRLIIVYTAEPDLETAASRLCAALDGVTQPEEDVPTLVGDHIRIVFVNKPTTVGRHSNDDTKVAWSDLPDRVIAEFTSLSSGLLRAHALQSVAAVRGDIHRIVAQFDPDYDLAFVGDRASKPDPDDGGRLIVEILLSEIGHSIASSEEARDILSADGCKLWLDHVSEKGQVRDIEKKIKFEAGGDPLCDKTIDDNVRRYLVDRGTAGLKNNGIGEHIRRSFADSDDTLKMSEERLAVLTTLAQHRGEIVPRRPATAPRLSLGTIVIGENGEFHLCLQPPCDAVRIGEGRGFLFVNLVPDDKKNHFVLPTEGKFDTFRLPHRGDRRLQTFQFDRSSGLDFVQAVERDKSWVFADSAGSSWLWVADLRESYAAQVSHTLFGNELSRPGLNQLEWLREKGPK